MSEERKEHGQRELVLAGWCQFTFYKLDKGWHTLSDSAREEGLRQFLAVCDQPGAGMNVRYYSTVGFRPDVDFFIWSRADTPEQLREFTVRLTRTTLGKWLHTPHQYVSLYRESPYPKLKDHEAPVLDNPKWCFVYPFLKTRAWYKLPMEERVKMMREHIAVGHKFERVVINTSYSFGLGDQEFVIAFDTDAPEQFEALVRRLRETEASMYTLRDTPIFMGYLGTAAEVVKIVA